MAGGFGSGRKVEFLIRYFRVPYLLSGISGYVGIYGYLGYTRYSGLPDISGYLIPNDFQKLNQIGSGIEEKSLVAGGSWVPVGHCSAERVSWKTWPC